jgi:DNA transposition AAA+ family ATPase
LKSGEKDGLMKEAQWLQMGRRLNVSADEREWKPAKTIVFSYIEQEILFCKKYAKARIFVDDCGIGKTFTAKYLSRTLKNCFYIDASQCKARTQFIRHLGSTLGVGDNGRLVDIMSDIKYFLHALPSPIVIIDEAGDLDYNALLVLKELWNATENACGWYMIGADGLRAKMIRGISNRKVGYRELFSRFSEKFSSVVPTERQEKERFYRQLITDVLSINANPDVVPHIVKKCMIQQEGNIGGLRRAESLLILNEMSNE